MVEGVFQARRSDVFAAADVVQRSTLSWLKKRLVLAETLAVWHVLVRNLISPLLRASMLPQAFLSFIKAFGFDPKGPASPFKRFSVCVSPKERNQRKGDPGNARLRLRRTALAGPKGACAARINPAKKFVRQGAGITRLALPSRASNICLLKTLADDFLSARFTGHQEQSPLSNLRVIGVDVSGLCAFKTLANDFLPARFTGWVERKKQQQPQVKQLL